MDFRFKRVYKDGTHKFKDEDFKCLASAFTSAAGCVFFEDDVEYIDIYDENDKKIATFYK